MRDLVIARPGSVLAARGLEFEDDTQDARDIQLMASDLLGYIGPSSSFVVATAHITAVYYRTGDDGFTTEVWGTDSHTINPDTRYYLLYREGDAPAPGDA